MCNFVSCALLTLLYQAHYVALRPHFSNHSHSTSQCLSVHQMTPIIVATQREKWAKISTQSPWAAILRLRGCITPIPYQKPPLIAKMIGGGFGTGGVFEQQKWLLKNPPFSKWITNFSLASLAIQFLPRCYTPSPRAKLNDCASNPFWAKCLVLLNRHLD